MADCYRFKLHLLCTCNCTRFSIQWQSFTR